MELTDKSPIRLTQISLIFSLVNFFANGFNSASIILFIVFTMLVYSTTRILVAISTLQHSTYADMSGLSGHLVIAGLLFTGIAALTYSALFGVFYVVIGTLYLISPNDRAWLAGKKQLSIIDNKIQYYEHET